MKPDNRKKKKKSMKCYIKLNGKDLGDQNFNIQLH